MNLRNDPTGSELHQAAPNSPQKPVDINNPLAEVGDIQNNSTAVLDSKAPFAATPSTNSQIKPTHIDIPQPFVTIPRLSNNSSLPSTNSNISNNSTCVNVPGYGMLSGRIHRNPSNGCVFFVTTSSDGSPLTFAVQLNDKKTLTFVNMNKLVHYSNSRMSSIGVNPAGAAPSHFANNVNPRLPKLEAVGGKSGTANFIFPQANNPVESTNTMKPPSTAFSYDSLSQLHNFINNGSLDLNKNPRANEHNFFQMPRQQLSTPQNYSFSTTPKEFSKTNVNPNMQQLSATTSMVHATTNPKMSQNPPDSVSASPNVVSSTRKDKTKATPKNTVKKSTSQGRSSAVSVKSDPTSHPGWVQFFLSFKKLKAKKIKGGDANVLKVAKRKWKAFTESERNFFAKSTEEKLKQQQQNCCANPGCSENAFSTPDRGPFYCSDSCMIEHSVEVFRCWVSNNVSSKV